MNPQIQLISTTVMVGLLLLFTQICLLLAGTILGKLYLWASQKLTYTKYSGFSLIYVFLARNSACSLRHFSKRVAISFSRPWSDGR